MFTYILAVHFFVFGYCFLHDTPSVKTPLGKIQGQFRTSYNGKIFSAFEGIPYAKPPIGTKRFEVVEPIEPWVGVWVANLTTTCPQPAVPHQNITQVQEDCLHINVYVPRKQPSPGTNLTTIVHIHGGAFTYGSSHWNANPYFLMDKDVIFVTFNYRLGILGFLSTEDDVVPGNNGLKDQVMALKWVQTNIKSFGGNPKSVTLTGFSSGSSCVHLHYFSDLSKNLFHRGFSISGVAFNHFVLQKDAASKAQRLATAVGCPNSDTKLMVECLKQKPFELLLEKMSLFSVLPFVPMAPFSPVVEKGSHPFLKDNPFVLLSKGEVQDLPWVVTNTPDEGLNSVTLNIDLETINNYWEMFAGVVLNYQNVLSRWYWWSTTNKIKDFYLKNQKVDRTNFKKFVQIFSDRDFLVDSETAVRWQAKTTKSPVYYARFSYMGDDNENKTVEHGHDIRYYFGTKDKPLSPNELKMKDLVLDLLVSYAKTGKPEVAGLRWEPTKYKELTYLNINGSAADDLELLTTPDLTPRKFWKALGFSENENLISDKDEL